MRNQFGEVGFSHGAIGSHHSPLFDIMEPTYIVIPSDENYPLRENVEVIGLPKLMERLGIGE